MKKADERKWLDYKETFQDYAMEKIAILQNLKLPEDSIIHCLIDGINNIAIKSVAASISTESVDDFLEQMHHITSTCGTSWKKSSTFKSKFEKPKLESDSSPKTDPHSKIPKKTFCVYCRSRDHTRKECNKLKKKEQSRNPSQPTTVSQASALEEPPAEALDSVVFIENNEGRKIITDCVLIKVNDLNNSICSSFAFLDTGSPISFISSVAYKKFFSNNQSVMLPSLSYKAVNNIPIKITGIINSTIKLEALPNFQLLYNYMC